MLSSLPGGLLGARHGSGPAAVVALHGWRRTHADFDAVLDATPAVAPDLPGFGASPPPPTAWGAAEYADALVELVSAEAAPVVLAGHSFGGRVALLLAARHPELVRALVLAGVPICRPPGTTPPRPAFALRAAKALNRLGLLSDERLEERRRRSGPADYRAATGIMRDVFVRVVGETNDGTYLRACDAVRCPVELVWGERDTAAPPAVARVAQERLADTRLTIVPATGHLVPTEAPGALRDAIGRHA